MQTSSGGATVGAGILARGDGSSIAYHRTSGMAPTVVFFHGFHSDMNGGKVQALEAFCTARGNGFLRFDAFGHGQSSGKLEDGTIGRWTDDAIALLDALTDGPLVLVGSSFGGWIALLAALQRRDRVKGLMGIAAAPDFTEDLMWAQFTAEQRQTMLETGNVVLPNCYEPDNPWTVPRLLIEEARNHLLLRDAINLYCPVRLIQGQQDADVPWETAIRLADALATDDVEVHLIKDGDHRLSREQDLQRLYRMLGELLDRVAG